MAYNSADKIEWELMRWNWEMELLLLKKVQPTSEKKIEPSMKQREQWGYWTIKDWRYF